MNRTVYYNVVNSWENTVAALVTFTFSLLGVFSNSAIVYSFFTHTRQKTAFNLICVFRAVNNLLIIMLAFIGIILPATVIGFSFYPPMIETILLTTTLNLTVFNEFQGIYLSINRLFAIFFPFKYNFFFGIKATLLFHMLYYVERIYHVTLENIERSQSSTFMLYSVEYLAPGCIMATPDEMFYWSIALVVFPFFINGITYIRFYFLKKQTTSRNSENLKNAKRNMRLFFQTMLQDSLFSIDVLFSMKLTDLSQNRLWTFFCQSFMWEIVHVLDGFIMLMFNEKLSLFKKRLVSKAELSGKRSVSIGRLGTVA